MQGSLLSKGYQLWMALYGVPFPSSNFVRVEKNPIFYSALFRNSKAARVHKPSTPKIRPYSLSVQAALLLPIFTFIGRRQLVVAFESGDIESRVTASAHGLNRWVKHKCLTADCCQTKDQW